MWRGVVFGGAGVFLVVAAASSGPDQAQGLDGSLCKIATTPLGPDSALAACTVPAVRLVVALRLPERPRVLHPPSREETSLPLRGRPLRDRYVLRSTPSTG